MFRLSQDSNIIIDLSSNTLTLYQNQQIIHSYPIAIGKSSTPTPIGHWQIINKKILTDNGVFGSRWMGLSAPSYGIHGTNNPNSIGTAASLGCIRLHNRDAEELFGLVTIGTAVTITRGSSSPAHPATSNSSGNTYIVRAGDTFWKIAQQYQLSVAQIQALNPGLNPQQLIIGQTLFLQ